MRAAVSAILLAAALSGCASWPYVGRGAILIDEADKFAREGDFPGAVAKYDEYLARYPAGWRACARSWRGESSTSCACGRRPTG